MKKNIIIGLVLLIAAICIGATSQTDTSNDVDLRNLGNGEKNPIVEYKTDTAVWASGDTGAITLTDTQSLNGLFERLDIVASNSTNAITYTVEVIDSYGASVFGPVAAIVENDTTTYNGLDTDTDFEAIAISGEHTFKITISDDPGASGGEVYLVLRLK